MREHIEDVVFFWVGGIVTVSWVQFLLSWVV